MVAFVSGSGLGLFNSSLGVLGGAGSVGDASMGRSGEQVTLNTATGNLVLQHQDELLLGRGPDLGLVRTYNSRGQFTDDNDDNWRLGIHKQVYGAIGSLKNPGKSIKRIDSDGSELLYVYDAARDLYINQDGAGSFDS